MAYLVIIQQTNGQRRYLKAHDLFTSKSGKLRACISVPLTKQRARAQAFLSYEQAEQYIGDLHGKPEFMKAQGVAFAETRWNEKK